MRLLVVWEATEHSWPASAKAGGFVDLLGPQLAASPWDSPLAVVEVLPVAGRTLLTVSIN